VTDEWLAEQFEADRARLRGVAYRMLGSTTDAEDAVQETWLRLNRSDAGAVQNLHAWLTTVVARISLDMLRSRKSRREDFPADRLPDPVVTPDVAEPEQEAVLADSVGLAMLVVLDTLTPAERLAFVLHDMFAVPFAEIATILDRSPDAAKQLASRARRRVRGAPAVPDPDLARRREVVDAFLAASRAGDFDALLEVLDPEVVLRADDGAALTVIRGAAKVAGRALMFRRFAAEFTARRVLVNGQPGVIGYQDGVPRSMLAFTVAGGRIVAMDAYNDPARLPTRSAVHSSRFRLSVDNRSGDRGRSPDRLSTDRRKRDE
jgi:RNA polymerase sigma factor (sigma-70 family)